MVYELYMLPALGLVALYRARKVSPVEVCEAVFSRIGQINPILNAFQFLDEPFVRAAAAQSEERWRRGEPQGLLDGVPVSVKDNLLTTGWPSLSGSRTINPTQQWLEDAPGVARLREHGAILIGKTTMPEFAWKVMTDSPLFGITRNPFNVDRTPGGSSGGAASATASGMGTLALATDGGGSIRVPASRCGLVGLKPTHGRVSDYPPSRFGTNSHVGPIARSVRDAALLMDVIAQRDTRDWYALPNATESFMVDINKGIEGCRIAYSPDLGSGCAVHPDIATLTRRAAQRCADLGAEVELIDFDKSLFEQGERSYSVHRCAMQADLMRRLPSEKYKLMDPALVAAATENGDIDLQTYLEAEQQRRLFGSRINQFFDKYDLLISPTIHTLAEPVESATPEPRLTMLFNASRNPAISIPCGVDKDGLPVGLQIIGPLYKDRRVLRAAAALEDTLHFVSPSRKLDARIGLS
jgi:aspartyl-tRNA(Asn)/glutamyl-tRNA(Gln) amidotransferase subunit A